MKKIHVVFHDGGGGHRNAAVALQTIASRQGRPWQVELMQFQDLTDRLDVLRKLTGIRIQQQYNIMLQNGWTLGSKYLLRVLQFTIRLFHNPMVRLLAEFWRAHPADLLVSVIPHFNREISESWNAVYPGRPFVTLITDLADYPPRFWIEPIKEQYVIAGTARAVEQARAFGHDEAHIFQASGMILRPDFYEEDNVDAVALRGQMGLKPDLPTAIVLFGGHGSQVMFYLAKRLNKANLPLQLILICGRNEDLASKLRGQEWNIPVHIVGFTKEVHKLMRAADFLIGSRVPAASRKPWCASFPCSSSATHGLCLKSAITRSGSQRNASALSCTVSRTSWKEFARCWNRSGWRNFEKMWPRSTIALSSRFQRCWRNSWVRRTEPPICQPRPARQTETTA